MRPAPKIDPSPTTFVGREWVLDSIGRAHDSGARVVTLLGPGGMGKTRTARRYAELNQDAYRAAGGAWFCDLTEARDEAEVWVALARTLAVPPLGLDDEREGIVDALVARGRTLLVLDNFEQLVPQACSVVARLSSRALEAKIVVTSRERLQIDGEISIELPPLDPENEAIDLFLSRAASVGRAIHDRSSIAALVRALDGIPLAIELAAARSRVMRPDEILARLSQRFEVLARARTSNDRHATLRRAIETSWDALTTYEQSALAQCSVFAGGFSIEAAEGVLSFDEGAPSTLDVLSALRDKSLLLQDDATSRLSCYVSIRELAEEKLATLDPEGRTRDRHATYFARACRKPSIDHALRGDAESMRWLVSEKENLLAAFRHAIAGKDADAIVDLALALEPPMGNHGPVDELRAMLDAAVEAGSTARDRGRWLRLRLVRGDSRGVRGAVSESLAELSTVLEQAHALGEPMLEGEVLVLLGTRLRQLGRRDEAFARHEQALALLASTGTRLEALDLASIGRLHADFGRPGPSRDANLRALDVARSLQDALLEGIALVNLAQLDQDEGLLDDARGHFRLALARFRDANDVRYEAIYRGHFGDLEHELGNLDEAEAAYRSAIEDVSRMRILRAEGLFRAALSAIEARRGHEDAAMRELDSAAALLAKIGDPTVLVVLDAHRVHLELARGVDAAVLRDRLVALRRETLPVEVRCAIRIAERALGSGDEMIFASDGSSYVVGGVRFDLARKGALRRILSALVDDHRARAGRGRDMEALLSLGWPGERVLADAASKRVRVAIATLRRMGLDRLIVTRDDGYQLDPAAKVRVR